MMRIRLMTLGTLLVGACLLAIWTASSMSLSSPRAAQAAEQFVTFGSAGHGLNYTPATVNAVVGDTITWKGNFQSERHPLVSDDGLFPTVTDGTQCGSTFCFSWIFGSPGTFNFHCQVHLFTGKVVVAEASGGSATPTAVSRVLVPFGVVEFPAQK